MFPERGAGRASGQEGVGERGAWDEMDEQGDGRESNEGKRKRLRVEMNSKKTEGETNE